MDSLAVCGGKELEGKIKVHGSKNSSLPIIAASLLSRGECVIHNCPELTDVRAATDILRYLGCKVKKEDGTLIIDSSCVTRWDIPKTLMHEMRSSIVFLGAILSRTGRAELCSPGGCEIGLRPIDLHLSSLRDMGAEIDDSSGQLSCSLEKSFKGSNVTLSFPSVGATENIIIAAAVSEGITNIFNAAREPEIRDMADFLNRCGADIRFGRDGTVTVRGKKKLHGCEYTVMPDRITAATYMCAAAACGGDIFLEGAIPVHMRAVLSVLSHSGCVITCEKSGIRLTRRGELKCVKNVRTMPYPGFPTDAQAPIMAVTCTAKGTSVITENIFESRFKHVPYLIRMGASIRTQGQIAVIDGVERLHAAHTEATDLRGGSALVVAALGAEGESVISSVYHIDRGYEEIEKNLGLLGADIRRIRDNEG